jgi:hypothetical protein
MRFKQDLLALAVLALLVLIFFWPVTLNLGWIPRGGGDLASFLWPTYSYAAQSLQGGRIPLWNHTLYAGAPFAADNQSGLFYPLNLLTFFLSPSLPYQAMEWLVVFHFWLAGASMYWLMRVLLPGRPASGGDDSPSVVHPSSLFAAVAYMFSDVFVTHVGNLNIVAVSAWLPAAFAALHLALTRRSAGWAAGAGILVGVAALAGHAQMTLILVGALGLYALWIAGSHASRPTARAALISFGLALLAFAVAFGISALSLIPAAEMTRYTARASLDYAAASQYSLPWAGLAGMFSPLLFGRGPAHFWGPWDRVELGYLGVLPLLFAGAAPYRERRGLTLFLALLAVFGWFVALGENAPLHRLLFQIVPGFGQLRVPARFILLTSFALAALAGLGLERLAGVTRRRMWVWGLTLLVAALTALLLGYRNAVAALGAPPPALLRLGALPVMPLHAAMILSAGMLLAGLALVAFRARLSKRAPYSAPVLALAILSADLVGHGAWVEVDRNDPIVGYRHPAAAAFLKSRPGPTRMDNASAAWSPDAAARHGLEDINGLHNPLSLAAYQTYLGAVGARGTPLYNFLNAQYVIADKGRPPADSTFVPIFDEDPRVDIYLNTNAMPRVSLVYSATIVPDGETAFGAIHAAGFDPASHVVAEGLTLPIGTAGDPSGEANLFYLHYAPESFTVVARTPAPAYLVFSEVWYPGWRAWVDGVEAPIFRANFAFRGVVLPEAGEHVVVMRFDPWRWKAGLGLTVLTLALLAGWVGVRLYRARLAGRGARTRPVTPHAPRRSTHDTQE